MPVFRYFAYVGCVLVALLLVANWIWPAETKTADSNAPSPQAVAAESPFEQTIRIQSARRWPEKIVFDTSQPTIVPPPAPHVAAAPPPPAPVVAANSPLDARAQLKPAPPAKRQARARHPASRPDFYNPRPDGWHDPWRDPWRQHSNAFALAGPTGPSWQFGRW